MAGLTWLRSADLIPNTVSVNLFEGWATPTGRPIWTFASSGLARIGQREVVLSVLREPVDGPDAAWPFDLALRVIREAYRQVDGGIFVDPGAHTALADPWESGITGLVYEEFGAGAGLYPAMPVPPVIAIPLLADETRAVYSFGAARVLTRLGAQARVYPFPAYFDRRRNPVFRIDDAWGETTLAQRPVLHAPVVEVAGNPSEVRISVPAAAAGTLAAGLRVYGPGVAILPSATHSVATQRYLWTSGFLPATIGNPPRGLPLIAGNFMILQVGETPATTIFEDGFSTVLAHRQWDELLTALENARGYRWRAGDMDVVVHVLADPILG
ncbi:hypothetical protein [Nocardia sp. NPDC050406]|uniref:hypothetical protein n=1 Tax=Nocardia sp. NPDC050406 TaxID=3364318 RepID=UPI0037A43E4D